ncbi:MAG: TolC family outer membrane protein [Pseudohongiellaceae bacterium]
MTGLVGAAEPVAPGAVVEGDSLEDFFSAALDYSPRLRIAEENLNIGSARKRQAKGQLLPQLSATASISENRRQQGRQLQEFDGNRYGVQLTQTLFNWQAFAARKRALAEENRAEAEYFYELAFVLTDVAEKYFMVLQAQDALTSISAELDAVRNQLEQVQSLFDRQLAQITDLRQVQASVSQVQAQQIRLQAELALAEEALRSASGLDVGTLFTLRDNVTVPGVEESVQHWVQLARENNQQILAREYAVQAAQEGISERRGAYLPNVSLVAQRQNSNLGFDNALIGDTEITYFGLSVNIPLYSGGTRQAQVQEARSIRGIAENELRQIELQAGEQVRSAYLQVQASQTLTDAAEALVESTQIAAGSMQEGYELGTVTSVDVLNALRDQFQAERDLQRTRYEHIIYLLLLKREAGILAPEDMMEVGTWLQPATP